MLSRLSRKNLQKAGGVNYPRLKKLLPHLVREKRPRYIENLNTPSNKSDEWRNKIALSNRVVKDRPTKEDLEKEDVKDFIAENIEDLEQEDIYGNSVFSILTKKIVEFSGEEKVEFPQ